MTSRYSFVRTCALTMIVLCVSMVAARGPALRTAAAGEGDGKPTAGGMFMPGTDLSKSADYHPSGDNQFQADGRKWPEVNGRYPITYSYSNFLDGGMGLPPATLKAVVEEALAVWAAKAPLDFIEVPDSGPPPSDNVYPDGHPDLRFGHHAFDGPSGVLAHAYFPPPNGQGLAGDLHFDNAETWTTNPSSGIDLLEVCVHEIGHAVGLLHQNPPPDAIMNPFYSRRYNGLGTAFLLQDDCDGIVFIYGSVGGGLAGDWIVDINWVPGFIDASFGLTLTEIVPDTFYTSELGGAGGWAFESSPAVLVMGNTNLPGLLYVGLNYGAVQDEAVGGWQQNTDVPNWGSHHMVRGTLASAAGDASAATGGQ